MLAVEQLHRRTTRKEDSNMEKTLKQKLRDREPVAGMHVALTDSSVAELCGLVGYDFLWIDTEHTALDYGVLQNHLIAAKAAGVPSIVRIPWNDPILAKRVLEQGPDGILFPMVNTPEELDQAMKSTLYPPEGFRGFGPQRAARWGLRDTDEVIASLNRDLIRIVQIETVTAVHNLKEMVKNPYVDCFVFGPCDLSGSINQLNKVFDKDTSDLIDEAVATLKAAGKSVGVSTGSDDPKVLQYWHDKGLNFISAGTDYLHIAAGARKVLKSLREIQSK